MNKILVILLVFLRIQSVISSSNQTILFGYSVRGDKNNGNNYKHTLHNLLSTFSSQATNTEFYNSTSFGRSHNNNLYGLYMCRGDIDRESCRVCVKDAAKDTFLTNPYYGKEAMMWYDHCVVGYSNKPFFGKLDDDNHMMSVSWWDGNITNKPTRFTRVLSNTVNILAVQAAYGPSKKKFATKIVKLTEDESLYTLVQCTPDLTANDCRKCLMNTVDRVRKEGAGKGGMVGHPNCMVRYEMFPFFYSDKIKPFELPAINSTEIKLRGSEIGARSE